MGDKYGTQRILFLVAVSLSLTIATISLSFVLITSTGYFSRLPTFSLNRRDPIVLTLFGATSFTIICAMLGLTTQLGPARACNLAFKFAPTMYALSYYFVNLFLLSKLRAVDSGIKAKWYKYLHKGVTVCTFVGMPAFALMAVITATGRTLWGKDGTYFCAESIPWWITTVFAGSELILATTYFILFAMPLIVSERQIVAARATTADQGAKTREVIKRNLLSCSASVIMTLLAMSGITIGSIRENSSIGTWTISLAYVDLSVNLLAIMYAIHPAWKPDKTNRNATRSGRNDSVRQSKITTNRGSSVRLSGIARAPGTPSQPSRELPKKSPRGSPQGSPWVGCRELDTISEPDSTELKSHTYKMTQSRGNSDFNSDISVSSGQITLPSVPEMAPDLGARIFLAPPPNPLSGSGGPRQPSC